MGGVEGGGWGFRHRSSTSDTALAVTHLCTSGGCQCPEERQAGRARGVFWQHGNFPWGQWGTAEGLRADAGCRQTSGLQKSFRGQQESAMREPSWKQEEWSKHPSLMIMHSWLRHFVPRHTFHVPGTVIETGI